MDLPDQQFRVALDVSANTLFDCSSSFDLWNVLHGTYSNDEIERPQQSIQICRDSVHIIWFTAGEWIKQVRLNGSECSR